MKHILRSGDVVWATDVPRLPSGILFLHRDNIPAQLLANGQSAWFRNGLTYRDGKSGPAMITPEGDTVWTHGTEPLCLSTSRDKIELNPNVRFRVTGNTLL
jgi:hypothetical protein